MNSNEKQPGIFNWEKFLALIAVILGLILSFFIAVKIVFYPEYIIQTNTLYMIAILLVIGIFGSFLPNLLKAAISSFLKKEINNEFLKNQILADEEFQKTIGQYIASGIENEASTSSGIDYEQFWAQLLENNKKKETSLFKNIKPANTNWISSGAGLTSQVYYAFTITATAFKVQFFIGTVNENLNKKIFEKLKTYKNEIEKTFDNALSKKLIWEDLPGYKQKKIYFEEITNLAIEKNWPQIIKNMLENMINLEKSISIYIPQLKELINKEKELLNNEN